MCYSESQNYSKSTCVLFICSMYLVLLTRIVLVTLREVNVLSVRCYVSVMPDCTADMLLIVPHNDGISIFLFLLLLMFLQVNPVIAKQGR